MLINQKKNHNPKKPLDILNINMKNKEKILIELESQELNPKKSHPTDSGWDWISKEEVIIPPQEFRTIGTGIKIQLPPNWDAEIRPRSGLAKKYGITMLNSPGTIDNTYRGEIKVIIINHGKNEYTIKRLDRIAQIMFKKNIEQFTLEQVECIDKNTNRS